MSSLRLVHSEERWREFVLDEEGISWRGGKERLLWSEVSEARVSIALPSRQERALASWSSWRAWWETFDFQPTVSLFGKGHSFTLGPEYQGLGPAVPVILEAVAPHRLARARDQLAAIGSVLAGPLTLTADDVQWKGRKLAREHVECFELFEASSVLFRVMRRRKIFPWATFELSEIPNFDVVLRLAFELGYPVRKHSLYRELLAPGTTARAL